MEWVNSTVDTCITRACLALGRHLPSQWID